SRRASGEGYLAVRRLARRRVGTRAKAWHGEGRHAAAQRLAHIARGETSDRWGPAAGDGGIARRKRTGEWELRLRQTEDLDRRSQAFPAQVHDRARECLVGNRMVAVRGPDLPGRGRRERHR